MNERIKELVDQILPNEKEWHKGDPKDWGYFFSGDELEKFAELIVGECANQCDLLLDRKISSEWARGTHDCSKAIKKHFGVKT
jgi:hypothetical protein